MSNETSSSLWSAEQELAFFNALMEDEAGKWDRIAAKVPGKTAEDVKAFYTEPAKNIREAEMAENIPQIEAEMSKDIEAMMAVYISLMEEGEMDQIEAEMPDGFSQIEAEMAEFISQIEAIEADVKGKRPATLNQRKNDKWILEEHQAFLEGLERYGRGDWGRISRDCVKTKSASQVRSHAEKFFIRQAMDPTAKRRKTLNDLNLETFKAAAIEAPGGASRNAGASASDVAPIEAPAAELEQPSPLLQPAHEAQDA